MTWTGYSYSLLGLLILIHASTSARPTFSTLFQASGDDSTDPRTGLPLNTTIKRHTLKLNQERILKQAKSAPTSSSLHHMNINELKSVQMNATTTLNRTACIALNAIQSLQSVICSNNMLKMVFDSAANSAYTYRQWIARQVEYINGGKEWNCKNSTTGEYMTIMMRLIPRTFKLAKDQITVQTTSETGIMPLSVLTA